MPRIDPHQLLTCLGVLLTPTGGILSKNEVQRLANLMTKFSKKLVSKCVYVLILKNTEVPLLGAFMKEGGWNLVHIWLQDGFNNHNWALVYELLELLLMAPTDVEQLKINNLPKMVKSLSKRDDLEKVKELANQVVIKWLKIVKDDQIEKLNQAVAAEQLNQKLAVNVVTEPVQVVEVPVIQVEQDSENKDKVDLQNNLNKSDAQPCYKLAVRDGKHVLCKVPPSEANVTVVENAIIEDITPVEPAQEGETIAGVNEETNQPDKEPEELSEEAKEKKEIDKRKEKSNHDRHKRKSSSSKSSSSREKDRKSSSSRDKSKEKSKHERSSKDSKSKHDKDKHKNNGSLKKSSSSSSKDKDKDKDKKETKEKQAEKDKDTLAKLQPPSLSKIGRIPKKASEEKKEDSSKKPTFSIEVRKSSEEKPKTVKVFNAKMRSTGLLEEAKPPPPRPVKKQQQPPSPVVLPQKRPSPIRDLIPPPEKKPKTEAGERPGAIKLIPPKPKPSVLQESDIFMDALTAASAKKEPKKRKRRASVSKDSQSGSPPPSPSVTTGATPQTSTTMALKAITPPKFYQDTLETSETEDNNKEKAEEKPTAQEEEANDENPRTPTDSEAKMEVDENKAAEPKTALKSVLVHVKRKGPKKSIKWKPDEDLVEVQYFELDETERVNVTKTFMDMAKMELSSEREAMQMRKLQNEDVMNAQTSWKLLIEIDLKSPLAEPGCKSLEKDIQFAREKTTVSLPPFLHGRYVDSPAEPEQEIHQMTDPVPIPLDDPENSEQELPVQPWPEPKGSPPQVAVPNMPSVFPNIQPPFQNFNVNGPPPPFQNMPFPGPGGFIPPNMMPGPNNSGNEWNNMNNGPMMPPNMPPDMMNQGPPPNMFGPNHDNFNPNMNENFPPFNQPNMNIFPPNNFNMRGRGGGFRRGSGNGPWVRMNGPGPGPGPGPGGWNQRGGGMNRGGRFCKNVKNHGYCRNRDNCPFIHPN